MGKFLREHFRLSKAVVLLLLIMAATAFGMNRLSETSVDRGGLAKTAATPNSQNCSHRVGNVWFTITNWGFFGSQFQQSQLKEMYCLSSSVASGSLAPSFEFPAGTGVNYLFQGALWIGAIVGEDTLVSVGADGWQWIHEMYPQSAPNGGIIQKSNRGSSEFFSEDAISEQDFVAEYTDTLVDETWTASDPRDARPHKPLGIKVLQRSYSWSYTYAEDFILLDYRLVNIGTKDITKAYMALYVDADNWHPSTPNGFADDISGYRFTVPSPACKDLEDSINIAWTADNDGDPDRNGLFGANSATSVSGTRVVRSPNPDLRFSFNWWVSNGDDVSLDWGPRRQENSRNFGTGGLGTPEGDKNKYYIISVREFDYDQIFSAVDHSADGWQPPPANIASNLADGYDTRYLFSFGPFDIAPGDTVPFTIGYIGGEGFHVKPDDFQKYFDANDPQMFYDRLDFTDFATNAQWAAWVYDNPGVDTDNDSYKGQRIVNPCSGDSVYVSGDGIPDFSGPPPPTVPILRFSSSPGSVTVRWNGKISETSKDPFSFQRDFEGYRVYMGQKLQLNEFALLTSYDHYDFSRHHENRSYSPPRWEVTEIPFTIEQLKAIYEKDGFVFDPSNYPSQDNPLKWDTKDSVGNVTSTDYYFFTPQDYNRSDLGGSGGIEKTYPDADSGHMVWDSQLGDSVDAYYEYEYSIDGLLPSRPVYLSVSTFDYGNPATNLAPLESSPLANAVEIYPVYSADVVADSAKKVAVFPNPYRINGGYAEAGYEDVATALSEERARRIHFANLPREATIRIYTLDGDLVRELQHPCNCSLQEGESMISWDLISRNTQAVVSGIYLYTVESKVGTQVGKFVIIK
jgi:hypothetical protein